MTVYNDLRFLDAAVDSILQQEFRDLELVIVDDGTGQDAIFGALKNRDPRIRLVTNPVNLGAAAAANRGIEAARADIIVRLDADDIAERTRVGRLVAALADDPQLGLVGSWCTVTDETGRPQGTAHMPTTDLEIRWTILFHNPFYHSTVAFRASCFEAAGRYMIDEPVSQDHYLWFHMLPLCRARNIAESLVRYRLNPRGLTATNLKNARNRTHPIRASLWARLGLTYDLHDDVFAADLSRFVRGEDIVAVERRALVYRSILTLLRAFLAVPQPLAHPDDANGARRLAHTIVARILANPPAGFRDQLAICHLCWPIDRRATIRATTSRVADRIKSGARATARTVGGWLAGLSMRP
jgi:glycosyltransferase involved in cell wall biosynthesis